MCVCEGIGWWVGECVCVCVWGGDRSVGGG